MLQAPRYIGRVGHQQSVACPHATDLRWERLHP